MTSIHDLIDRTITGVEASYSADRFVGRHGAAVVRRVRHKRTTRAAAQSATAAAAVGAVAWGATAFPWNPQVVNVATAECERQGGTVVPRDWPIALEPEFWIMMRGQHAPTVKFDWVLYATEADQEALGVIGQRYDYLSGDRTVDDADPLRFNAVAAILEVTLYSDGTPVLAELRTPDGNLMQPQWWGYESTATHLEIALDGNRFYLASPVQQDLSFSFLPVEWVNVWRDDVPEEAYVSIDFDFTMRSTHAEALECVIPSPPSPSPWPSPRPALTPTPAQSASSAPFPVLSPSPAPSP